MMKTAFRILAICALSALTLPAFADEPVKRQIGALKLDGVPEIPSRIVDRMFQYQSTRSASLQGWMRDGSALVSTRFAETSQLHKVTAAGGAREQLTFFPEPVRYASTRPGTVEPGGFLFSKDVGGDEQYQIYWYDGTTGGVAVQTDGKSRNGSFVWSNDGALFAYNSTARNGKDWDTHLMKPGDPASHRILKENAGAWYPLDFSPDDKRLLVLEYISRTEAKLHVIDTTSGSSQEIGKSDTPIAYGDAVWGPDSKTVYLTSDQDREFLTLRKYNVDTGDNALISGGINWDITTLVAAPDRRTMAFITNEDGISRLWLYNLDTGVCTRVKGIDPGQIYSPRFSHDGATLGFVINTARTAGDVYATDIAKGTIERWTKSEVGGLDTSKFALPELVRYPTFDKDADGKTREIPAFVFKPEGAGPHPVLISIHGGPESQYRPYFSSFRAYLVGELGIAVVSPNVRGSAGYGKDYLKLDNGMLREDSVKDIGALIDWIAAEPELDGDRVVVMGGSYGGYMTLASMIHYNDRLRGGIDVVGISNFVTFLENTKDYRRDLRRVEYGDERDPEMRKFLEEISPTARAKEITKPMFVAQGLNDPRVPASEAEQIVDAIRTNGGDVWYLLAEDEGHGFRKKSNRDFYLNTVVLFLETHLLGAK